MAGLLGAVTIAGSGSAAAATAGYTASYIAGAGIPVSVAVNVASDIVYLGEARSTASGGDVRVINGSSHATLATIPLAAQPVGIAVDSATNTVYATDGSQVAVISGATNKVSAFITMPSGTAANAGIAVDSTTDIIYAAYSDNAGSSDGSVIMINGKDNTVTATVSSGGVSPWGIAVDETTDIVWVANSDYVAAISGTTGTVIHSAWVGDGPASTVAVNPATDKVYVGTLFATTTNLIVIDGATGGITFYVPSTATGGQVEVDPVNNLVFSPDGLGGLDVVDGATNTVTDNLPIVSGGSGAAVDPSTGTVYETTNTSPSYDFPGVWSITASASNAVSPLIVSGPSAETAATGHSFTANFTASGVPAPGFSETGHLPGGVTLSPTGVLSGTPATGTGGAYRITITASNGIAPDYSIPFTLTVEEGQPPAVAVAAVDTSGVPYAQAPQLGPGWHTLGGTVIAPPAVAALQNPDGTSPAAPLFIAPGPNHLLYIRGLTGGWQRLGPKQASCLSAGAVITGSTLTVACEGLNHALYSDSATVPATGLPQFTNAWKGLGGVTMTAGPAVAPVGGVTTFFIRGTNGKIYTRTLTGTFTQAAWSCLGTPAAAVRAVTGVTYFVCEGVNHGLYEASSAGAAWSPVVRLSGTLAAGPAVAAASRVPVLLVEGTNGVVYEGALGAAYSKLSGIVARGVEAAALN